MTIYEFAKKLNNGLYGREISPIMEQEAKELGFVVVFGYSDDNAEFRGAIDDEVGCYDGGRVYENGDQYIDAVWCEGEFDWEYRTNIPHATFDIYDAFDEKYCRGIVFEKAVSSGFVLLIQNLMRNKGGRDMTERERLTELIMNPVIVNGRAQGRTYETALKIADHLLANGVIVPPCKVGDTVYSITECTCENIDGVYTECEFYGHGTDDRICTIPNGAKCPYQYLVIECYVTEFNILMFAREWGKTVFLTREEAEKALEERSNDGKS